MKRIALAVAIAVCLMMLSSSFVPEHDYPPTSSGFELYPYMMYPPPFLCWSVTPNELVPRIATPTPASSLMRHVPATIYMGKPSDLSFIYEDGKLAYVQFFSKDDDSVVRVPYDNYRRLSGMGKAPYYGTFAPGDRGQAAREAGYRKGVQEKAKGLDKYTASVQEMVRALSDYTRNMINMVRTDVVPAVDGKIVTPLRDYTQSMINKVRTDVVPAVNGKIVNPLRDYTQNMINKVRLP